MKQHFTSALLSFSIFEIEPWPAFWACFRATNAHAPRTHDRQVIRTTIPFAFSTDDADARWIEHEQSIWQQHQKSVYVWMFHPEEPDCIVCPSFSLCQFGYVWVTF